MSAEEMNNRKVPKDANKAVNTSGQGPNAKVPEAVKKKFNWGVFFFTWIWGIVYKKWITFLIFVAYLLLWIPIVGQLLPIGLCIWFGIKGNEWAWQSKRYRNINDFHSVHKKWAMYGVIILVLGLVISVGSVIAGFMGAASSMMNGVSM